MEWEGVGDGRGRHWGSAGRDHGEKVVRAGAERGGWNGYGKGNGEHL